MLIFHLILIFLFTSCSSFISLQNKVDTYLWFENKTEFKKGVALVVHGLNNKPSVMDDLINELNIKGISVLRIALKGHRGDAEEFKHTNANIFTKEVYEGYVQVKKYADKYNLPVYAVGFSLGGATILNALHYYTDMHINKMILLAPAITLKPLVYLLKMLSPFHNLVIPSLAPNEYKANSHTTIVAYNAIFDIVNNLEQLNYEKANIESLIFIDEKDTLVSLSKLITLKQTYKLTNWQIKTTTTDGAELSSAHHLIVNHKGLSDKNWKSMLININEFL